MGSDMIERVARALVTCEAWSSFWSDDDARTLARAAIAAMREPTPYPVAIAGGAAIEAALLGRGSRVFLSRGDRQTAAVAAYEAMIDAALAEGATKPPNEPA